MVVTQLQILTALYQGIYTMNNLELAEKELELKKVEVAKDSMELEIMKMDKQKERLEQNIQIQINKILELKKEIKALKGE